MVWLHYSARVKGETEPFDETYTVGRPKGMTVGAGEVQSHTNMDSLHPYTNLSSRWIVQLETRGDLPAAAAHSGRDVPYRVLH